MSEIRLIGLSGQLQNGKDTVADLILELTSKFDGEIQEPFSEWYTRRFAGVLKKATAMIIGCELADLERDEFKNKPLGEEWRRWYFVSGESDEIKISSYFSTKDDALNSGMHEQWLRSEILTPRLVLQLLGTEGGREVIHPNIWVNATLGNLTDADRVIVTDVRFPNEVTGIKVRKGIVVRVIRPSKISTSTHPSETALNDFQDWDYVIVNDGTIEDLKRKVIAMLEHFGIVYYTELTLR
jgi:hypothetical protein